VKLWSGLIIGFIIGVLATIGFLQLRTGQLPSLNSSAATSGAAPPAAPAAPAGGSPPAADSSASTPQKTQ
jgi:hypothetical protein